MAKTYKYYCAGEWRSSDKTLEVRNPYDDSLVGTTSFATDVDLDDAITAAEAAFEIQRYMPAFERIGALKKLAELMKAREQELVELIAKEAGKPIRDARVEVMRGIFTVEIAAEEAGRIGGELIPLDLLPSSKGRFGVTRQVPIGPISGISPFNFPLNLALHKIAPAIASGNPIVLKPPTLDPLTMLVVAEMIAELDLPAGAVSIMPMDREVGDRLVTDDRFKLLSFTGSPDVGWDMKARAGKKKVVLELGGNAGVAIDKDADIDFAVSRVRAGGFAYAGQVCISVQRVFVHVDVYDEFCEKLASAAKTLVTGDPLDPDTELGPMIDEKAANRIHTWVQQSVDEGARVLTGGNADGRFYEPTVLVDVARQSFVCSREAFAPIVTVFKSDDWGSMLEQINDSVFGLQAGIFTDNFEHVLQAFEKLDVGGVIINDVPAYRIDHMPYGGVKDSGLSREGLRYAIEDMTETRMLVVNRP